MFSRISSLDSIFKNFLMVIHPFCSSKIRGDILKKLCTSTHISEKSHLSSSRGGIFFDVQTYELQKVVGFEYVQNAGAILLLVLCL